MKPTKAHPSKPLYSTERKSALMQVKLRKILPPSVHDTLDIFEEHNNGQGAKECHAIMGAPWKNQSTNPVKTTMPAG